jgi:signal peptidase I
MNWTYNYLEVEIPLPAWALKKNIKNCFFYSGRSMHPTFKNGYLIYTISKDQINPSDIIVYKEMNSPKITVHRVMTISKTGLITRGDNNSHDDPLPIMVQQILGVVAFFEKKGHVKPVPTGKVFLTWLKLKWKLRKALKIIRKPFFCFYRLLKKSNIIRIIFGKWFDSQISKIIFETSLGSLTKTIFMRKTIAVEWPHRHFYSYKKPFDLLIGEQTPWFGDKR